MMNIDSLRRISAKFEVSLADMCIYIVHMKPNMGEREILQLFFNCEELRNVKLEGDEEIDLKEISESLCLRPTSKIEILLQCYLSNMKVESASLVEVMDVIFKCAKRHIKAFFEVILDKGWADLAEKALILCKRVGRRVQTPLQLCINNHLPKLKLKAKVKPLTRSRIELELTIIPVFQWDEKINGNEEPFWIIVKDNEGKCILYYEYFCLKKNHASEKHVLYLSLPICEPLPSRYKIVAVSYD